MTMLASFDALLAAIRDFRAVLDEQLAWAIANARPPQADHALADRFEDWCVEVTAAAGEAEMAGLHGHAAAEGRLDLGQSAAALATLHSNIRRSVRLFNATLASFEAQAGLQHLAGDGGMLEWAGWADEVAGAVARCRAPLERIEDEVVLAWAQWSEIACAAAAARARPLRRAKEDELGIAEGRTHG